MITYKKKFNEINKWHKKQVSAPGSILRSMTPPCLGAEGQRRPMSEGKRTGKTPPGTSDAVDEISVWKGRSASPVLHLIFYSQVLF